MTALTAIFSTVASPRRGSTCRPHARARSGDRSSIACTRASVGGMTRQSVAPARPRRRRGTPPGRPGTRVQLGEQGAARRAQCSSRGSGSAPGEQRDRLVEELLGDARLASGAVLHGMRQDEHAESREPRARPPCAPGSRIPRSDHDCRVSRRAHDDRVVDTPRRARPSRTEADDRRVESRAKPPPSRAPRRSYRCECPDRTARRRGRRVRSRQGPSSSANRWKDCQARSTRIPSVFPRSDGRRDGGRLSAGPSATGERISMGGHARRLPGPAGGAVERRDACR